MGSVPGACTRHPGQDRDADKYDYRDHHIESAHFRDNKGPRNAANDKSKTDEINYQGHEFASWLKPASFQDRILLNQTTNISPEQAAVKAITVDFGMRLETIRNGTIHPGLQRFSSFPGSPARISCEKSGDLSSPFARSFMRLRFFSSGNGRLVSTAFLL